MVRLLLVGGGEEDAAPSTMTETQKPPPLHTTQATLSVSVLPTAAETKQKKRGLDPGGIELDNRTNGKSLPQNDKDESQTKTKQVATTTNDAMRPKKCARLLENAKTKPSSCTIPEHDPNLSRHPGAPKVLLANHTTTTEPQNQELVNGSNNDESAATEQAQPSPNKESVDGNNDGDDGNDDSTAAGVFEEDKEWMAEPTSSLVPAKQDNSDTKMTMADHLRMALQRDAELQAEYLAEKTIHKQNVANLTARLEALEDYIAEEQDEREVEEKEYVRKIASYKEQLARKQEEHATQMAKATQEHKRALQAQAHEIRQQAEKELGARQKTAETQERESKHRQEVETLQSQNKTKEAEIHQLQSMVDELRQSLSKKNSDVEELQSENKELHRSKRAPNFNHQAEIDQLQKTLQLNSKQKLELQVSLARVQEEHKTGQARLLELDARNTALQRELDKGDQYKQTKTELEAKTKQVEELQAQVSKQAASLSEVQSKMRKMDETNIALFGTLHMKEKRDGRNTTLQRQLDEEDQHKQTKTELEMKNKQVEELRAQVREQAASLSELQSKMDKDVQEREMKKMESRFAVEKSEFQLTQAKLQTSIKTKNKEIDKLKKENTKLQSELEEIKKDRLQSPPQAHIVSPSPVVGAGADRPQSSAAKSETTKVKRFGRASDCKKNLDVAKTASSPGELAKSKSPKPKVSTEKVSGRWSKEEEKLLVKAYFQHGEDYEKMEEVVGTRTAEQCEKKIYPELQNLQMLKECSATPAPSHHKPGQVNLKNNKR